MKRPGRLAAGAQVNPPDILHRTAFATTKHNSHPKNYTLLARQTSAAKSLSRTGRHARLARDRLARSGQAQAASIGEAMNEYPDSKQTDTNRVETIIEQLTDAVRRVADDDFQAEGEYGWWVLACGAPYAEAEFADRDALREQLRAEVEAAGIFLPEFIWVWDETRQAQLVITTLPTRDRAERVAQRLRNKGLTMRVAREHF
jgi:hypothetical protein